MSEPFDLRDPDRNIYLEAQEHRFLGVSIWKAHVVQGDGMDIHGRTYYAFSPDEAERKAVDWYFRWRAEQQRKRVLRRPYP